MEMAASSADQVTHSGLPPRGGVSRWACLGSSHLEKGPQKGWHKVASAVAKAMMQLTIRRGQRWPITLEIDLVSMPNVFKLSAMSATRDIGDGSIRQHGLVYPGPSCPRMIYSSEGGYCG